MPVFTFEKISPPVRRGPIPPIAKKQRGVIVQILDRFVTRDLSFTSNRFDNAHQPGIYLHVAGALNRSCIDTIDESSVPVG